MRTKNKKLNFIEVNIKVLILILININIEQRDEKNYYLRPWIDWITRRR